MRRHGLLLAALAGVASCSPQAVIGTMPAVMNVSSNRTLRRDLLGLSTGTICKELMKRTVPLKLNPDDPAIGRFFPTRCELKKLTNGDLHVEFAGTGYVWSNLTRRVGFNASAGVHFEQDFRLDGSTAYVYFRPVGPTSRSFDTLMVEGAAFPANVLARILPGNNPEGFVRQVAEPLFFQQLGEGFTVIRQTNGDATVAVGSVDPGDHPIVPYERRGSSNDLYANERVELHRDQRDFLGPIDVPETGMAIHLTLAVEGAPSVDVQVHPRITGEPWLQQYIQTADPAPAPAGAVFDETIVSSPDGAPVKRSIRVPPGQYFVVLDNTSTAGKTPPAGTATDDRAPLVHAGVEVGAVP